MRARWMVALVVATAAVAVFDWRGRQGAAPVVRSAGSTEWLADVSAHTAAAKTVRYVLEMAVTGSDDRRVVLREDGAADTHRQRRWRTVALRRGEEAVPPLRVLVDDDRLWVAPGFVAEQFGLEPTRWVATSLGTFDPMHWDDVLPRPAQKLRDLLRKAIGDAVVVGRENLRQTATTHVRSWADGRALDVWVDDDQRLRQVETVRGGGPGVPVSLRLQLFDYDEPVEIHPPGPDVVLSDDELAAKILARLPGRDP